ncbi:MAG: hypothetical protein H7831_11005 [Magnetococcus sp. WYHC-3]
MNVSISPEVLQMESLLKKCREENNPDRLLCHMQALKTFLVAHLIQQSTLVCQIKQGQELDGELEDLIIDECSGCVGDSRKVMQKMHAFLRKFEDGDNLDTMEFRVEATRLLNRFEQSMARFREWFEKYSRAA